MKYSEKNLRQLIRKNLMEKAMDFDTPDRPHSDVTSKLATGDTPLKKVPFPRVGDPNKNFQEILASESYKKVVERYRRILGVNAPPLRGFSSAMDAPQLYGMMGQAHNDIVRIESQHREELEELAVKLVMTELGIEEGQIIFDAKIVGMGEIDTNDFTTQPQDDENLERVDIETEPMEEEIEIFKELENFNLERAKRRLINAIIQGGSKQSHDIYHTVDQELIRITGQQDVMNKYATLMGLNDISYWQLSNQAIGNLSSSVAGKEDVESVEDPETGEVKAKVVARGINFPVLVHELLKGVYELLAMSGRPEGDFSEIEDAEDIMSYEMWDLRLGDAIWNRLRMQMPEELLINRNKRLVQTILYKEIFKLPAREFLVLMKEVLQGSERGKRLLNDLVRTVELNLEGNNNEEALDNFRENLNSANDQIDDDDLYDALRDLGITPPED